MSGEETDMTVVVRSKRVGGTLVDEEDGTRYYQVDFSLVNLDKGIMLPKYRPSLYCCTGDANMVKLGDDPSTLYVIGGARHPSEISEKMNKLKEANDPRFYMGASRFSALNAAWEHINYPNFNSDCFQGSVASMMGKVYCFGRRELRPEVYDPMLDEWKPVSIPSDLPVLDDWKPELSLPVVPDPQNNRILVHLDCGYLYAFYPHPDPSFEDGDGGRWQCLFKELYKWPDVAAVVDSILYCHNIRFPSALRAYDLVTGKWLSVTWSTLELGGGYHSHRILFTVVFSVGKGVLCLASPFAPSSDNDRHIVFFKISVQRISPSALLLTPLSFHSFIIPSTQMVLDVVPLKDVW